MQDNLNSLCQRVAISAEQMLFLLNVIRESIPDTTVWAFGSRITDKYRPMSDLDLAVLCDKKTARKNLPWLNEALIESDLPFKVQVLDYNRLPQNMQDIIKQQYVVLHVPENKK